MTMKYRKIKCPEPVPSPFTYRAQNSATGETLEGRDLAPLLSIIADSVEDYYKFMENGGEWKLEVVGR